MNLFNEDSDISSLRAYDLKEHLKSDSNAYFKDPFHKENSRINSRIELIYTPVKRKEKRLNLDDTPFSILSINEDSACIQTRSRKLHDSALPLEHWKSYNSNLKKPKCDRTPFEEFFGISGKKPISLEDSESDQLYNMAFNDSILKKRISPDYLHPCKLDVYEKVVFSATKTLCDQQIDTKLITKDAKKSSVQNSGGCNCGKSKCLKLYCDCFKQGNVCGPNCFCCNCENKEGRELRQQKLAHIRRKNPEVFNKMSFNDKNKGIHKNRKGCNCRKSECLKNYCECHQAGAVCNDQCNCKDCKNTVLDIMRNNVIGTDKQRDVSFGISHSESEKWS